MEGGVPCRRRPGCAQEEARVLEGARHDSSRYEFRALVRLAEGKAGFTYPGRDLREILRPGAKTLAPLKPVEYIQVPEECRVFG